MREGSFIAMAAMVLSCCTLVTSQIYTEYYHVGDTAAYFANAAAIGEATSYVVGVVMNREPVCSGGAFIDTLFTNSGRTLARHPFNSIPIH